MPLTHTRRRFLTTLSLTGAAGLLGAPRPFAAEPQPETTTVRLPKAPVICFAPQYVCEELLRDEGFSDIRYVDIKIKTGLELSEELGHGSVDFASNSAVNHIFAIGAGAPITIVSPVHGGCYELFAQGGIRSIADLKGKSVGAGGLEPLISMFASWVGGSTRKRTSRSSSIPPRNLWSCSLQASSTLTWDFRLSRRSCAREAWDM